MMRQTRRVAALSSERVGSLADRFLLDLHDAIIA